VASRYVFSDQQGPVRTPGGGVVGVASRHVPILVFNSFFEVPWERRMKKIKGSSDGVAIWEKYPYSMSYEVAFKMKGISKIIRMHFDTINSELEAKAVAKALRASKLVQVIKLFHSKSFWRFETEDVDIPK